jgi:hypothetical protein
MVATATTTAAAMGRAFAGVGASEELPFVRGYVAANLAMETAKVV